MERRRLLVPLACLLVSSTIGLGATLPAVADQSAASSASFTMVAGGLSITAPSNAGSLGSKSNMAGATTISGQLGQVQVVDERGAPQGAGWTATAISTAFTQTEGPGAGASIGAGAVGYTTGAITKTGSGTATYAANDPVNLTGVSPVVTATEITGNNTATWNPTIKIAVAANMAAGVYPGTITHSVS